MEVQATATGLGVRMLRLRRRDPEAYQTILQQLTELEANAPVTGVSRSAPSSSSCLSESGEPQDNCVTTGVCGRERNIAGVCGRERNCAAVEADSVGAPGAAAAREEKGTQAYEARRPSVFARLGALQGDSGVSSSRGAATWSPEGGVWPCYFAAAYWCCDLRMLG